MNQWQEGFVRRVDGFRGQAANKFERVADGVFEPVFGEFTAFLERCDFEGSTPQAQPGLRSFKFALAEDAYVIVAFRFREFSGVDCECDCFIPGEGRIEGPNSHVELLTVDREWTEQCFRTALDAFMSFMDRAVQADPVGEVVAV